MTWLASEGKTSIFWFCINEQKVLFAGTVSSISVVDTLAFMQIYSITPDQWQYSHCIHYIVHISNFRRETLIASLITGTGFTLKDLESVPFGVALPIREAIYRCREQPCSDWSEEVCLLIGRQDLTKQAHKMTLAKSKSVSIKPKLYLNCFENSFSVNMGEVGFFCCFFLIFLFDIAMEPKLICIQCSLFSEVTRLVFV